MSGVDEVIEAVDDAIGCLAPFVFMVILLAGMKFLFWLLDIL